MPEHRLSLVVEFCQNHNGDFDLLCRMVDAAAEHGATHGKMQTIYADDLAFRPQFEEGLTVDGVVKAVKRPYQAEYDRLRKLEISMRDTERFIERCKRVGLVPMTTCLTRAHVQPLAEVGFDTVKVASYDCASFPMLRELKARFDEIIVSTGATFDGEIEYAAEILGGTNFAMLHCVTIYPTPLDQTHLARMELLGGLAPRVGFSDHSLVARDGLLASKAAIFLGAEIIERHFTLLGPKESRDGPVSIRPEHLAQLAVFATLSRSDQEAALDAERLDWHRVIGERRRPLSDAELLNRDYYRGRFASRRPGSVGGGPMVLNWEETPLPRWLD